MSSTRPSRPLSAAFERARAMALSLMSTAVTCSAPASAQLSAKEPVCVKQSSTRSPRHRPATARRLYFWSRKKPVFCPFAKSTLYFTPFSVITRLVSSPCGTPSYQPETGSSPSLARRGDSLRSYIPRTVTPISSSPAQSARYSTSLRRSMPRESICVTSMSPKRSTVTPGRPSASPKMSRQASKSPPMTRRRYSRA